MKERILNIMKPLYQPKGFKADELEGLADFVGKNLKEDSTDEEIKAACDAFAPIADYMQKIGNRYATGVEEKFKGYKPQSDFDNMQKSLQEDFTKKIDAEKAKFDEERKRLIAQFGKTDEGKKKNDEGKNGEGDGEGKNGENQRKSLEEMFKIMQEQQEKSRSDMQKAMTELITKGITEAMKPYREKNEREFLDGLLSNNEKVKAMPEAFREKYKLEKAEDLDSVVLKMETDFARLKQEMLKTGEFMTPPPAGGKGAEDSDTLDFLNKMAKEDGAKK